MCVPHWPGVCVCEIEHHIDGGLLNHVAYSEFCLWAPPPPENNDCPLMDVLNLNSEQVGYLWQIYTIILC